MNVAKTTMPLEALLGDFVRDAGALSAAQKAVTASGVCLDSRLLEPGDVYLAMGGGAAHGLQFVDAALDKGACAVVVDDAETSAYAEAIAKVHAAGKPLLNVAHLRCAIKKSRR